MLPVMRQSLSRRRRNNASYDSIIVADGALEYWPMQETSGSTVTAKISSANNGTYNGGFTLNQSGPAAGVSSVNFNGTNGYALLPAVGLSTSGGPASAEIWANAAASSTLFEMWSNDDFVFLLANGPTTYILGNDGEDRDVNYAVSSGWHHFVETINASNLLTLYVDGVSVATSSAAAFFSPLVHDTTHMLIAAHSTPPGSGALTVFYSGNFCRAAVYGSCLSSTQVAAHYAAGV